MSMRYNPNLTMHVPHVLARRLRVWRALRYLCETCPRISATGGWFTARVIAARSRVTMTTVQDDLMALAQGDFGIEMRQAKSAHLWRIRSGAREPDMSSFRPRALEKEEREKAFLDD